MGEMWDDVGYELDIKMGIFMGCRYDSPMRYLAN
jgi:hypothetical protein